MRDLSDIIANSLKTCCKCKEAKPLALFDKSKDMADGLYRQCKPCKRAKKYPYDAKGQSERTTLWKLRNPERAKEVKKRGMEKYKEKSLETMRKWRDRNRDRVRDYLRMSNARRRAGYGPRIRAAIIQELMAAQRSKCAICSRSIKFRFHLDHIMPLIRGGAHDKRNLQLLCPHCNCSKRDKHPIDFMQSRGFLL